MKPNVKKKLLLRYYIESNFGYNVMKETEYFVSL
jgi:hypothetical protein